VVVVSAEGAIVADFEFEHSLEGWKSFADKTSAWPNLAVSLPRPHRPGRVTVILATSQEDRRQFTGLPGGARLNV